MKNIVPISIFGIYDKYLRDWSGGRLCLATIDYFKITDTRYAIGYAKHDKDGPISISLASRSWPYSIIVTKPDFRGCGYGKQVLKRTIRHFQFSNLVYNAWIASDNEESKHLLESCGLKKIREQIKQRTDGDYLAYLYSSKK